MTVFGWIIASLGAIGVAVSAIMELKTREPIYMVTTKVSAGILGVGGIILAILSL